MSTCLRDQLDIAKAVVTIADAWTHFGLPNPPPAGRDCVVRSPFRDDRQPSFSIFAQGRRFRDHAFEEHRGDVIDFVQLATGHPKAGAIATVLTMAGDTTPMRRVVGTGTLAATILPPKIESLKHSDDRPALLLADAELLRRRDADRIAASRGLPASACHFLRWAGHLLPWFDDAGMLTEWHLADAPDWPEPDEDGPRFPAAARVIEARRLDRQPFRCGAKAWTLPGSRKDWPVGLSALAWPGPWYLVLAVEGGPDLLAAHALIEHLRIHGVLPVAILSRGTRRLHPQAADLLAGRHVHVIPHNDADRPGEEHRHGRAAAEAWAANLFYAADAARVTCATLESLSRHDGEAAKDLCEAIESEGIQTNRHLLPKLLPAF